MTILREALEWRYATKKMDPSKPVDQEKVDRILEAIRLTPSSSGLQPYHIFVISDKTLQAKIMLSARNQSQVVDCSHLLVFAAWDKYTNRRIDYAYDLIHNERGYVRPELDKYRESLKKRLPYMPPQVQSSHTAKQTYIAAGTAMIAAAMESVDATPIEGFDPKDVETILDLSDHKVVLLMPLGHRDDNDWLLKEKKVRKSLDSLFTVIK
jgi:nitroreductase/dihydropteridine reductase